MAEFDTDAVRVLLGRGIIPANDKERVAERLGEKLAGIVPELIALFPGKNVTIVVEDGEGEALDTLLATARYTLSVPVLTAMITAMVRRELGQGQITINGQPATARQLEGLNLPVTELKLKKRATLHNAMRAEAGERVLVGDVLVQYPEGLMSPDNRWPKVATFGPSAVKELQDQLTEYGLPFPAVLRGWKKV